MNTVFEKHRKNKKAPPKRTDSPWCGEKKEGRAEKNRKK
jgi:hypothetical protein